MALVGAAIAGDLRATAIILNFCDPGSQASSHEEDDAAEKSDDFSTVRRLLRGSKTTVKPKNEEI